MKKNHVAIAIAIALSACSKKDSKEETPPPAPGSQTVLNETFDNPSTSFWPAGINRVVQGGQFIFSYTATEAQTLTVWGAKNIWTAQDKYKSVEVLQTHTSGHASYDKAGIVFSLTDATHFFGFQVDDNSYRVFSQVGDKVTNVKEWIKHAAIKGGMNESNKLKIVMADGTVSFFINDQKVYAAQAGSLTTLDKVGYQMVKGSFVNQTCTYKVDYIKALK